LNPPAGGFHLRTMNSRQLIVTLYVVLLTVLGLGAGSFFYEARQEYALHKATEAMLRQKLTEKQAQLEEQKRILVRLQTDPSYVEKVIRKRMNYGKPGETMFRFPED
jgi:cell division protein DivIC